MWQISYICAEGFQRAIGKPFGRLRRGEIPCEKGRQRGDFPLPFTRNVFLVRGFAHVYRDGPRRGPGGDRKAPWSHPQVRNPAKREKQERLFPLPFTRNVFLVRGFARLRADEVLSPRGKVPKGRRGRPKGACGVAAPGPPVAKQQCAASLAGARPARFTSVPGRAAVAFGAVDPSPGVWAPVDPWSGGKGPREQEPPGPRRIAALHAAGYGEQQEHPIRIG